MNKKLTKIITLILSCLLLIGAAVGITVSANAGEQTPAVEIVNRNVSYEGAVQIVYALKAENADGLTIKVVFAEADDIVIGTTIADVTGTKAYVKNVNGSFTVGEGEEAVKYPLVYSNGIVAKELRKNIYAVPVLVDADGNVAAKGATQVYSPYTYAMNRIDNAQNTTAQLNLYRAFLDYGAAVQDLLSQGNESLVASWGGWADEYYNVTYVDSVRGYNYTYKRAATVKGPLVLEADKFAEGKIFVGFFDGENQVYQTGKSSSTWNVYDIKPGSKAMNVVATYVDGTNPYAQLTDATALPSNIYLTYSDGNVQTDSTTEGMYDWFADGVYNVSKVGDNAGATHILYASPFAWDAEKKADDNKAQLYTIAGTSVSYEFDIRLNGAEKLRSDEIALYLHVFSDTEYRANSNYNKRPTAFTHYYKNNKLSIESSWIDLGEWVNVRLQFEQHPTLPGYLCSLYVNGKLVNDYPMDSILRATTGFTLPYIALESRYPEYDKTNEVYTDKTSDISYSIDNFRIEYEACTEHEWTNVEHVLYKKSDATCIVGSKYYQSCAKCSFRGTELFEADDKTQHEYAQLPYMNAIKTPATVSSQTEYYVSCSNCGTVDAEAETFFYGAYDVIGTGKLPYYVTGSIVTDGNSNRYAKILNENGNDYIKLRYYDGESHFVLNGGFDPKCVDTVVYEFDYRFDGSSKRLSDNGIGWFYPTDASNTKITNYHCTLTTNSDGTALNAPKSMQQGEWHHLKFIFTKVVDETTGDIKSFNITAYVDDALISSTFAKVNVPYAGYVPGLGLVGRYSGESQHSVDNIYVYATHSGEVTENTEATDALHSAASCTLPAVYHKSCAKCGIIPETFVDGDLIAHTYKQIVTDAAIKTAATANSYAVYYQSCEVCGELDTENTFLGDKLDDLTDGKLPATVSDKRMNATVKYESEAGRNYVNVSGTTENVFILDGDFDINCVDTVTYEFDYRFAGSTSHRASENETDNRNIGWFYFYNPDYITNSSKTHPNFSTYGRLGYWSMYSDTKENATSNTMFGKSFNLVEWHTIKVVLTKQVDGTTGDIIGWAVSLYVDGVQNSTSLGSASFVTGAKTYIPAFGIWGRGSVDWSHDIDNISVTATHSGELTADTTEDTIVRAADCYGPAVYSKCCATCGIAHEYFIAGESATHNYVNVVTDAAFKSAATANNPAVYYKSCERCGLVSDTLTFAYGEKDWLASGELWPTLTVGGNSTAGAPAEVDGVKASGGYHYITSDTPDGEKYLRIEKISDTAKSIYVDMRHDGNVVGATSYTYEFDFRFGGMFDAEDGPDSNNTALEDRLFSGKVLTNGDLGSTSTKGTHATNWHQNPYTATANTFSFGKAVAQKDTWYHVKYVFTSTGENTWSVTATLATQTIGSWTVTELEDNVPYVAFVSYSTYTPDTMCYDIKNYSFYADNGAHAVESAEIISDSALSAPATAESPATYYYSYSCCGALDYSKTFTHGDIDYLAKGEKYPVNGTSTDFSAPKYDEETGEQKNGFYNYVKQEANGNYVWHFEAQNALPSATISFKTGTDNLPVENATKYVYSFDFRYNSGSTYVKVTEKDGQITESTVTRAFLLRGPSATGKTDRPNANDGTAGRDTHFKQWTVNVDANGNIADSTNSTTGFFATNGIKTGEWINVQIEYIPNYTDGVLVSYNCSVCLDGVSVWSGNLSCFDKDGFTNAPIFDIYVYSGVKNLSFDLDNCFYICEVAEVN